MSSAERRALVLLLSLGLAGQAVRWWVIRPGQPPGEVQLLTTLTPRSPGAHRDSILTLGRPLGPDERIDADRASPQELARLPRIGLGLAKAIVADREARGAFGGPEGLDRVPGIGLGLLAAVRPHLTFSGTAGANSARPMPLGPSSTAPGNNPLDLNSATAGELARLPGIGPARARAIVADRERHGSFSRVDDLDRIPGIGPAAIGRLSGLVRVP